MSKLLEALGKLDPTNDNHWTAEGLPRLETVRMLAGDQTVSREAITQVAPEFNRATAAANSAGTEQPEQNAPVATSEDEREMETELAELDSHIAKIQQYLEQGRQELEKALNRRDALVNALHKPEDPTHAIVTIQAYLQSQTKLRENEAARRQVLAENGVGVKDIMALLPQNAPIDKNFGRK